MLAVMRKTWITPKQYHFIAYYKSIATSSERLASFVWSKLRREGCGEKSQEEEYNIDKIKEEVQ